MGSFLSKLSSCKSNDNHSDPRHDAGVVPSTSTSATSTPHSTLAVGDVASELQTSISSGLSEQEAQKRLERDGENVLEDGGGVSAFHVFVRQTANALTLVLVGAMALSFGVKDWVEGGVITAVILLNIITGFYQEYSAEQTMSSLRSLSSPTATVIRSSTTTTLPSKNLVRGDIICLKPGDSVPADGRLIEVVNLEVDEMLLTGESLPVEKVDERLEDGEIGVGDRRNMVWSGTIVAKGRGKAIVTATGMQTQLGKIALSVGNKKKFQVPNPGQSSSSPASSDDSRKPQSRLPKVYHAVKRGLGLEDGTPLQIKLSQIAYILFLFAIVLALIVMAVAKFDVTGEVAIYAIVVGVAIVPESLVLVLTTTMAAGTLRMARSNVIVRKSHALEALGGVSDICSDKTGTITQGKMITRKVWLPTSGEYTIESGEDALTPTGMIICPDGRKMKAGAAAGGGGGGGGGAIPEDLDGFARSASLCNVSTIFKRKDGKWAANGDPTEVALQVFCQKVSLGRSSLVRSNTADHAQESDFTKTASSPDGEKGHAEGRYELKVEFPFDSSVKRMTTVYYDHDHASNNLQRPLIAYSKGAVERILPFCSSYRSPPGSSADHATSTISPMTAEFESEIVSRMEELASQGLRVLAFASKHLDRDDGKDGKWRRDEVERGFTFLGIAGLYDPPRLESKEAIRTCMDAGIVVRMLTGDHPSTARAIAKEVGLITNSSPATAVFTASEFDRLSDDEIDALPELPLVIARCAPETKVRMIAAGKRRGRYMAMTGDGVNDSPSLKQAPIGIAMGLAGSDVAKDASDLVLTDDNFASIVKAIAEGRRIFDNIKRFILVLLAANTAQVIALVIGLAFQDSNGDSVFPLSPLQILWINMLTSPGPSFGLGLEKPAPDVMTRPPHDLKAGVFTWEVIVDTMLYGFVSGATCLANFVIVVYGVGNADLGTRCNEDYEGCDLVFRARATVFATMMFQLLVLAWEAKSFSRSMFALEPGVPFWTSLYENKILFWSVILAGATAPALIYIPVLNKDVFQTAPISWEWGLVAAAFIVFVAAIEIYKITLRKRWFGTPREWQQGTTILERRSSMDTNATVKSLAEAKDETKSV